MAISCEFDLCSSASPALNMVFLSPIKCFALFLAAVPDMLLKSDISSIPRPFSNSPKQFHARVLSIQAELVHYETDIKLISNSAGGT